MSCKDNCKYRTVCKKKRKIKQAALEELSKVKEEDENIKDFFLKGD